MNIIKSMLFCVSFIFSGQIAANKTYTLEEAKEELKENPYALHDACQSYKGGNYQKVEMLIKAGADVNAIKKYGNWTPLHYAACDHDSVILTLLINNGANVNAQQNSGTTPLWIASNQGTPENIEILFKAGADINYQNKTLFYTPLMNAASNSDTQKNAIKLVELGAVINYQDDYKKTALHLAARQKHSELTQLLLEKSADPFQQNRNGWTSLHFAAGYDYSSEKTTLTCTLILGNLGFFNSNKAYNLSSDHISEKKIHNQLIGNYHKKKHFTLIQKLLSIKNNDEETAIEIAENEQTIAFLNEVKKAQLYYELPQEITAIAENNIKRRIQ